MFSIITILSLITLIGIIITRGSTVVSLDILLRPMGYLMAIMLILNTVGVIPYSIALTSNPVVDFALAIVIMLGINILQMSIQGGSYINKYMPVDGFTILLLLLPLEVLAYLNRVVSLALRLMINIGAGKFLTHVFMELCDIKYAVLFLILLLAFEAMVAYLQAFIFTYLVSLK